MDGGGRRVRGGYAGRNKEVPTEVAESSRSRQFFQFLAENPASTLFSCRKNATTCFRRKCSEEAGEGTTSPPRVNGQAALPKATRTFISRR